METQLSKICETQKVQFKREVLSNTSLTQETRKNKQSKFSCKELGSKKDTTQRE